MTDGDLLLHARALGLDQNKVMAAITHNKHKAEIEADQDQADDLKANGTPHFFINGRRLVGAQPIEKFRAIIDEEVRKAEALVRAGTPAGKVYEKLMATAKPPDPLEKRAVPAPTKLSPSRGPKNAKVVVQMFSDFQCPFCKRVNATIEELENAYPRDVRVVWRNYPLPFHNEATPAAEAAMEAFAQKGNRGFWAMFELIFNAQGQPDALSRQSLESYAAQLGLDMNRFTHALDTHVHVPAIEADKKIAGDAKITGTPAFVVGEYYISGAQPLAKFRKAVELSLGKKK
jgi:protein-disulfide isomerase